MVVVIVAFKPPVGNNNKKKKWLAVLIKLDCAIVEGVVKSDAYLC